MPYSLKSVFVTDNLLSIHSSGAPSHHLGRVSHPIHADTKDQTSAWSISHLGRSNNCHNGELARSDKEDSLWWFAERSRFAGCLEADSRPKPNASLPCNSLSISSARDRIQMLSALSLLLTLQEPFKHRKDSTSGSTWSSRIIIAELISPLIAEYKPPKYFISTPSFDSLPAISLSSDSNISDCLNSSLLCASCCVEEGGGKGSGGSGEDDDDCTAGDMEEAIRFPFKLVCIRGFKTAAFSITSWYWERWASLTTWTAHFSFPYFQMRAQYHRQNPGYGQESQGFGHRSWTTQLSSQQQPKQATRDRNLTETKHIVLRMEKIFSNHALEKRNRVYRSPTDLHTATRDNNLLDELLAYFNSVHV